MSLHRDLTACEGRETGGVSRELFYRGRCECGWEGEERSASSIHAAGDLACRDYRLHVEEALGAEAYYAAPVACKNCGSRHTQGVLVGTHVTSNVCHGCGTRMLIPANETWEQEREVMKGWFA